jgi:hypothetical protein
MRKRLLDPVACGDLVYRAQKASGLAPKSYFISAEPVERVVGQIGQTQKATREVGGRVNGRPNRFQPGRGQEVRLAMPCQAFESAGVEFID